MFHFFFLHYSYKNALLQEVYLLVKHGNFTYHDVMYMPVYQRRYFLHLMEKEMEQRNMNN